MPRPSALALTLLAALAVASVPAGAQDWESMAAHSGRSLDGFIVQVMVEGDLETGIAVCKGLGRRPEMDVQAVLDLLVTRRIPGRDADSEVQLRWLLASARQAHPGQAALRAWLEANWPPVNLLLGDISRWKDAQLKGAILALAVIAPKDVGARAIMDTGQEVVRALQDSPDGLIPSQGTALALDFLAAARAAGDRAFFQPCVEIARLSREKVLVDAARAAARELAAAP